MGRNQASHQQRIATTWAAGTLTQRGWALESDEYGWLVQEPNDGAWHHAADWRELCDIARGALT